MPTAKTAAPKAPLLDLAGSSKQQLSLRPEVFAAELKPHLVHETVRAESASARAGTQAAKRRGLVSGGRSKPWRQKGTGRSRQGTTRAPHWRGGGVAFAPQPRDYELKVNRKARRAALRGALAAHAGRGSLGVLEGAAFAEPSTKQAAALLAAWGQPRPLLVVVTADEEALAKSFRNLGQTVVLEPAELEVGAVVWARSLLLSRSALTWIEEVVGG